MPALQMDVIERYRGAMLGLAVGDALGTTHEFAAPGSFEPVKDLVGGGPFRLRPGEWTDDTSMALCLAASLIERGGFDALDQMRRYVRWWHEGYMSVNGRCFDIGNTTRSALAHFERTGEPYAGSTDEYSAGNGSLMRLAPVPLAYSMTPQTAIELSAESSRTTHGAKECLEACRYFAGLLVGVVSSVPKSVLLAPLYCPVSALWKESALAPRIRDIALGSFKSREPPTIRGSGYVVHTLETALWAFYKTDTFEAGLLRAVSLGEDTDTVGAVYGQLAGAYYRVQSIPERWRNKLAKAALIEGFAERLYKLSAHLVR